jgi:hypothetical protein
MNHFGIVIADSSQLINRMGQYVNNAIRTNPRNSRKNCQTGRLNSVRPSYWCIRPIETIAYHTFKITTIRCINFSLTVQRRADVLKVFQAKFR